MTEFEEQVLAELKNIRQVLTVTRELTSKFVNAMVAAEAEIPESMRRYMNYMHDVHDVRYMYESLGHSIPPHVNREIERLDDRYRQLLKRLHDLGPEGDWRFEKIRQEMAKDPDNRWDHTRLLYPPANGGKNEAGKSEERE